MIWTDVAFHDEGTLLSVGLIVPKEIYFFKVLECIQ